MRISDWSSDVCSSDLFGIFGGIFADRRLRFGEAVRIRQVEQHQLETQPHDMAVRVDQSGDEGLALAILFEVGAFGALVLAVEQLLDLAFAIDDAPGESDELGALVEIGREPVRTTVTNA